MNFYDEFNASAAWADRELEARPALAASQPKGDGRR